MGVKVNALTDGESEYAKNVIILKDAFARRIQRVWLYSDFIYYNTSEGHKTVAAIDYVHNYADEVSK